MNPRYPVYIVSRGRAETSHTSRALDGLGVPHYVIIEEREHDDYARHLPALATILHLPPSYQTGYDLCGYERGENGLYGSGPPRNFAWDHSYHELRAARHWSMDDNIRIFARLNRNIKTPITDGAIFAAMEDFSDRYINVAMSGPQYWMFAPQRQKMNPVIVNTRVYSCNLIRNDLDFRWRGRYNEDTDLSLRMLKQGWCTIIFNAFLADKLNTTRVKGGNTEDYVAEGTLIKSQMLARLHPDVTQIVWKYNRWHHEVDYKPFKNNVLVYRPDYRDLSTVNEYGMRFERKQEGGWATADANLDELLAIQASER